jgi:hypothetical protein
VSAPSDPAFDPRWLDTLAALTHESRRGGPRLQDLYLERRLEIRLHLGQHTQRLEEIRTSGTAARWASDTRLELDAVTGCEPRAVADLLGRAFTTGELARFRPVPPPALDPPRGWRDRCQTLGMAFDPNHHVTIRLMLRRAAVVADGRWTPIESPLLVHAHHRGPGGGALLATWDHPSLERWFQTLAEPPPSRPLVVDSGLTAPVVFADGTAGALMHEIVGHLLEADHALGPGSPLTRQRGELKGPETLTVIDDPTEKDLPGGFTADDEGVPANPITLILNGRPQAVLADRRLAAELGVGAGRGRRSAWNLPPVARMSNLVVASGRTPPVDLESDLRRGLVVTRLGGATVDPASGRVSIRVERGWEIRQGRRRRALAPCALTGTTDQVLGSLDPSLGVDSVPDWRLGWCVKDGRPLATGARAPTMLVPEMLVL